ncbi:hypothetical protein [Burkholderia vietnamiensis]|uniref:hypothetical protein n=1 Tax=Burkholderia vietnamiensis TaxID=60552 RepID=UPI000757946D|nr:hypothetical protein [Burkholderia vietnamiensis]KVR83065.1 hypothetical protein WK26_09920 [Burkholderia vietnamiensis]MBR7999205.1 hypothetical protein [Burkholderia vietnamiensis]
MTTDNTPRAAALTAAQHEPPAADERPTDDALWDQTLHERDNYQEWADKLANAIAAHLNVDIGEHSNVNNPWREALEAIENAAPASAPVGLTDELRAVMQDAARSLSVRADELKESNTSIDGKWCDADEKAAYDAEVRLVERLRALLATQQPEPRDEVTEEQPSLTNPLTPYGMLVRALRIVAGTLLGDMAKHLACSSATLSAVEFGRKPLTDAMIADTAAYFSSLGIPDTLHALNAARSGGA